MRNNTTFITALAFFSVYLFWGGTYIGMKFAIESFPPFLMAGIRHLCAGLILLAYALYKGEEKPSLNQIKHGAIVGIIMLMFGNGLVAYAEKVIPSSIASLVITTTPFWILLLNWKFGDHSKPKRIEVITLLIAFTGILLLIFQGQSINVQQLDMMGMFIIAFAAFCWSAGSLYSRYKPVPKSSYYNIASQTISGGLVLLVFAFSIQEAQTFNIHTVSTNSIIAMVYLIVFGSIIGYSAYIWLMKNVSPSLASSNAFINPVVALILGYVLANEVLSTQSLIAAFIIILAVTILTLSKRRKV